MQEQAVTAGQFVPLRVRARGLAARRLLVVSLAIYGTCVGLTGMTMLGRLAAYDAIRQRPVLVLGLLIAAAFILAIPFFINWLLRWANWLAIPGAAGLLAMMLLIAPRYKIASSSDQGDCIVVAAERLRAGLWPYDAASLWSHNPLSCGPGWVIMHMPLLEAVSLPLTMLGLIAGSFALIAICTGKERLARFIVLLALIPGFWQYLGNRVDFPTFAIVLAALAAFEQAPRLRRAGVRWLAVAATVLISHFRLPFLLIPSAMFSGSTGKGLLVTGVAQGLAVFSWLAFFFWEPEAFVREGPMHVVGKFTSLLSPQQVVLLLLLGSVLAVALMRAARRRLPLDHLLLFYLTLVILPISMQNLAQVLDSYDTLYGALRNWEGLSWLTGPACFAAWTLSSRTVLPVPGPTESLRRGFEAQHCGAPGQSGPLGRR